MNSWTTQQWYVNICNELREAREASHAFATNDPSIYFKLDALVRYQGIQFNETIESERQLIIAIAEGIACSTVKNQDCSEFSQFFQLLPPLKKIRDILLSTNVHNHVRISQDHCRIEDARIPPHLFWNQLRQQVFDGCDND